MAKAKCKIIFSEGVGKASGRRGRVTRAVGTAIVAGAGDATPIIKISKGKLLALVAAEVIASRQTQSTENPKNLITAEFYRRLNAGELAEIGITKLSKSLAAWLETVTGRPHNPRSIANRLRDWELWPLPAKK